MNVRYTAFGAMAVSVDGEQQPLSRRRERGVLAVLLAAHGAPVAAERLVAEVWGDESPGQTLASLQVAVSRLRAQLEPDRKARKGSRLVSTAAGYSLVADVDDVDTWAFESLAEQALAAGPADERLRLAEKARGLWTALPYADCDAPSVRSETSRLEELLLTLEELRARALLDLGRPDDAARALAELAPQHPYRERMWSLLALAQYQCARQADALDTLRRLRERLADELGVDPSEEIQQLEQAVLRQEPSLAAAAAQPAPRPFVPQQRAASSSSGTVGREDVLAQAVAVVEDAAASRTVRFLLLAGEPGIGKTRLVDDLSREVASRGAAVLVGRCHEGDYAPALWPWLAIVRSLSASGDVDPLLVPLLEGEVTDTAGGAGTGLRMFDAVVELVARAASERPLLLVLEDVHWADSTSLQLLRHLARSAPPMPVAVLCTRRTTEATTGADLVDALAALSQAGADRLRLDGLDNSSVGALLTTSIGEHDPALDEFVAEVTGGNPFFVLQYARQLAGVPDLEHVDPSALPVPDGIRDVLRQRIQRLPEPVVRTLTSAAVLGRSIDPDLVAELAGVPVDDCLDQLDLALTSGLVEDRDAGYVFVHALARETLYAEVSAARRMRLHDRAGRLIEERHTAASDSAADIAHHADLAAPLGPEHAARAFEWLARAASVASARHAHHEALELWRRVLAEAPADSVTAAEAYCGAGAAQLRLARTAEARASIEQAVRIGRSLRRWDLVVRASTILNGSGVWSWREHGVRDDTFIATLQEAAEHVTPVERARLLATLQMELNYAWEGEAGERAGTESLELARAAGDPAVLQEVLLMRILLIWGPDRADRVLDLIEEALALRPEGETHVFLLFQLGRALYEQYRPDDADDAMRTCAEHAAALRHTGIEIPLAWWWYARARDEDSPDAAEIGARASRIHAATSYTGSAELVALSALRQLPSGAPVPPSLVEQVRDCNPALRALGAIAVLESGDPGTAYSLLDRPHPVGAHDYSVLSGRCAALAVLSEIGTPEEIRATLELVAPYAGQVVTYGTVDHLGVTDYFLACGYAALGDPRAREHAEQAVVLNQRLRCLPWLRRSEALLARMSEG